MSDSAVIDTQPTPAALPAAAQDDVAGMRVLLITDRPFINPVDGSSHTYLMWLKVLLGLGCEVSVLSFSRFSQPWTEADRTALSAATRAALVLDAFPSRGSAMAATAVSAAWRCVAGRRFVPQAIERGIRRRQRGRIAAFLAAGQFEAVVVNKLLTTTLIGRDLLQAMPAVKLIDMHDNFPQRERLNYQVFFSLMRRHAKLVRKTLHPRDMLGLLSWAGQRRLLAEEASQLSMFDHVIFNAREEAACYTQAGVPAGRISVLPLPRPPEDAAENPSVAEPARPFAIGLIASGSLSNIEAVDYLAREILPRLRASGLPGVRLLVAGTVGRYAKAMLPPADAEVLGWIDDVGTLYDQVEVVLVPLLTGTGVSVKTMEAAAHGAAIVSTTVGARGVELVPGQDMIVADGADAFAAAVRDVLADPALRAKLRRNAQRGLRENHSRDAFSGGVAALLRRHAA